MDRFHFERISDLRAGDEAALPPREAHHLRVKRARVGDRVRLFDGAGREAIAEVVEPMAPDGAATLRIVEEAGGPGSACDVTLAVAMPKGKRDLFLVEKATELGVAALVPLVTRRTVGGARTASGDGRLKKWASTALEAAKQCGVSRLPEIRPSLDFGDALRLGGERRLILDPRAGARPLREMLQGPRPSSIAALIGPEGGFTDEEVEAARAAGFEAVRFGGTVLRIETAAIALLAAVVAAWE